MAGGIGLNGTNRANGGAPVTLASGDWFSVGGYVDRRVVYFDERGSLPARLERVAFSGSRRS